MGLVRIICPNCKRILGDTDKSVDCQFNCRGCKKTVRICMKVVNFSDYIKTTPRRRQNDQKD